MTRSPTDLPAAWRERAEWLRDLGAPDAGQVWLKAAEELDASFNEAITPAQAEAEGLGDAETVARKLRTGRLKNMGRKFNPLVRRGDLIGVAYQTSEQTTSYLPAEIERRAQRGAR